MSLILVTEQGGRKLGAHVSGVGGRNVIPDENTLTRTTQPLVFNVSGNDTRNVLAALPKYLAHDVTIVTASIEGLAPVVVDGFVGPGRLFITMQTSNTPIHVMGCSCRVALRGPGGIPEIIIANSTDVELDGSDHFGAVTYGTVQCSNSKVHIIGGGTSTLQLTERCTVVCAASRINTLTATPGCFIVLTGNKAHGAINNFQPGGAVVVDNRVETGNVYSYELDTFVRKGNEGDKWTYIPAG